MSVSGFSRLRASRSDVNAAGARGHAELGGQRVPAADENAVAEWRGLAVPEAAVRVLDRRFSRRQSVPGEETASTEILRACD